MHLCLALLPRETHSVSPYSVLTVAPVHNKGYTSGQSSAEA